MYWRRTWNDRWANRRPKEDWEEVTGRWEDQDPEREEQEEQPRGVVRACNRTMEREDRLAKRAMRDPRPG